jgi:hypothetical protein
MPTKKQRKVAAAEGEQLPLIDVTPANSKEIISVARDYKKAVSARMRCGEKEVELKKKLLGLVEEAKLERLADGVIRFKVDGMLITVTPRDELIKVKEDGDDDKEG